MLITEAFGKELNFIQNVAFKKICIEMLNAMPQYIITQPSSSTGKYHPTDETGKDGMIRHIKRCILLAQEACVMLDIPAKDKDVLIAGCLFHDSLKMGPNEIPSGLKVYTNQNHPIYAFEYIKKYADKTEDTKLKRLLQKLAFVCLYHEGKWTIEASKQLASIPNDYIQFLCDTFHLVDFFASRRSVYEIMQSTFMESK